MTGCCILDLSGLLSKISDPLPRTATPSDSISRTKKMGTYSQDVAIRSPIVWRGPPLRPCSKGASQDRNGSPDLGFNKASPRKKGPPVLFGDLMAALILS